MPICYAADLMSFLASKESLQGLRGELVVLIRDVSHVLLRDEYAAAERLLFEFVSNGFLVGSI